MASCFQTRQRQQYAAEIKGELATRAPSDLPDPERFTISDAMTAVARGIANAPGMAHDARTELEHALRILEAHRRTAERSTYNPNGGK